MTSARFLRGGAWLGALALMGLTLSGATPSFPSKEYYSKENPLWDIAKVDVRPVAVHQPPPPIPFELSKLTTKVHVVVEFIISKTGTVEFPKVVKSTDARFNETCLATVMKWKFKPAVKNDKPVNCRVNQALEFN